MMFYILYCDDLGLYTSVNDKNLSFYTAGRYVADAGEREQA
jgi:hypothetical protein